MGQTIQQSHNAAWDAICRSQAVIKFAPDGRIQWANDVFLAIMGYRLDELVGEHHRIFCDARYAESAEYAEFWRKLGQGHFDAGEYQRVARNGEPVWCGRPITPFSTTRVRLTMS